MFISGDVGRQGIITLPNSSWDNKTKFSGTANKCVSSKHYKQYLFNSFTAKFKN